MDVSLVRPTPSSRPALASVLRAIKWTPTETASSLAATLHASPAQTSKAQAVYPARPMPSSAAEPATATPVSTWTPRPETAWPATLPASAAQTALQTDASAARATL